MPMAGQGHLIENKTKRKLQNNQLALGFSVQHLRTSATAMIAAAGDHDWLFIDMEHGAFSTQEATQLCLAALPTGITPIVRVCAGALDEGTRALDNGALGVVVPHVETVAQAKRVARASATRRSARAAGAARPPLRLCRPAMPRRRPRSTTRSSSSR